MSLSLRLAEHVAGIRYEDLPPVAVDAAKRSLLDAIAVSLGASGLEPACEPFVRHALAAQGAPHCTILGYDAKAPPSLAAFANGALAHALDYEDAYDGAPLHPNAALVPAALAIAEAQGGVSGRDFIAALAVGCDLTCRLALCARTPAEKGGWYPPPIYAAYGATAAAGRLLGLNATQMLDAFSMTLSQATCSGEIKNSPHSVLRAVRDAFPAQAGVISAQMAARGVRGFDQPFDGEYGFFRLYVAGDYNADVLLADLGVRFLGADVSFKPWPSCRGTHAFIEASLALLREEAFGARHIENIDLVGSPIQHMLMKPIESKRAPKAAIDAKFSLPFVVATALVRETITLDDFGADALRRPDVLALAKRVSHRSDDSFDAAAGRLSVTLNDGRMFEREVRAPLGSPSNPLSWEKLVAKAADCAARSRRPYARQDMETLAGLVLALENSADAARDLARVLAR